MGATDTRFTERVGYRLPIQLARMGGGIGTPALIAADGGDPVVTTRFGADWPDAPHRVLACCVAAAERQHGATPLPSAPATRDTPGDVAATAMYAGTGVGAVHARRPATDVVAELFPGR